MWSRINPVTNQWRIFICLATVFCLVTVSLVACGTATAPTGTSSPGGAVTPDDSPGPTATVTPALPLATASAQPSPQPERPQTARDRAVAVIAVEPEHLSIRNIDAHGGQLLDTISGYMGHVDRDTRQVSPSSLIQAWQQTAPDQWEYDLRPGVTFHDGASWDVAAWQEYARVAGTADFPLTSYNITGPYTVEEIGPLKAGIRCGGPCPLFEWGMYLSKTYSPKALQSGDIIDLRDPAGAGPYQVVEWVPGQKILTEAFEDYVPAPESPEFAAPILGEIEWTWREETSVRAAMIEVGEADWSFLLSQDDANRLGPDQFVVGGTAEMAWYRIDTIWDPWLSQKEMRQALVHSIDCQAIVDSLYQGTTACRGNFGAPGVNGINEENIRPYEYDPTLSRQLLEGIGYICGLPNSAADCEAEIAINSRSGRIPMHQEMVEAMVSYMRESGINAQARFLEGSIRAAMRDCGVGIPGAQRVGWQGATENKKPPTCEPGQILDIVGTGYEDLDYGKFIGTRLRCVSSGGTVCFPEREAEWNEVLALSGEARRQALEAIATTVREEVLGLPLFDLSAIYGVNPKLRGFEQPRFDKHLFANLWWFEE